MAEVERLRKSNSEILDDYKKAKEAAKAVPQDVDVNALIAFKQKKEQEELEAKGRYEEATEKLASQFREAEEQQKQKIEQLKLGRDSLKLKLQQLQHLLMLYTTLNMYYLALARISLPENQMAQL